MNTLIRYAVVGPCGDWEKEGFVLDGILPSSADAIIRAGCHRRLMPTDDPAVPDGMALKDNVFDPTAVGLPPIINGSDYKWHVYRGLKDWNGSPSLRVVKADQLLEAFRNLAGQPE